MALDLGDENINSVEVSKNALFVSIIVRIPSWEFKTKYGASQLKVILF